LLAAISISKASDLTESTQIPQHLNPRKKVAGAARRAGLTLREVAGVAYDPWSRRAELSARPDVNYIAHFYRPAADA
jgi:2-polyprenyl-3-methyl-5-hydroxy-6-metoxy-1,4-benzoquinol methylase